MRNIISLLSFIFVQITYAEFSYKECGKLLAKALIMPNMEDVTRPIIQNSGHSINYLGNYDRCLESEGFDYFLV